MEKQRRKSEEKFGAMCPDAIEPVENFSCMHLGVNFRKAFFNGIRSLTSGDSTSSQQQLERNTNVIRQIPWFMSFANY